MLNIIFNSHFSYIFLSFFTCHPLIYDKYNLFRFFLLLINKWKWDKHSFFSLIIFICKKSSYSYYVLWKVNEWMRQKSNGIWKLLLLFIIKCGFGIKPIHLSDTCVWTYTRCVSYNRWISIGSHGVDLEWVVLTMDVDMANI